MKKIPLTSLAVGMLSVIAIPAFAATPIAHNFGAETTATTTSIKDCPDNALCAPLPPHKVITPTYTVTIATYVDGHPATASSTNNAAFNMKAWWSAKNIGHGSGAYTLSSSGYNSPNPYEAVTSAMSQGGNYHTREAISWKKSGGLVSGNCRTVDPFTLEGYTTGNTLAEAAAATPTRSNWPGFKNLTSNKFMIVWNRHCLTAPHNVSPKNGTHLKSASWIKADWTDVTDPYGTVTYDYESSHAWATHHDGSFLNPIYQSTALTTSEISTSGTPAGTYYWHAKAVDSAGNSGPWSSPFNTTVTK